MILELNEDVQAMEPAVRLGAATAMVTIAGNIMRDNMPVDRHEAVLVELTELLGSIILGGSSPSRST
jgi:hypothetical protein